LLPLRVLRRHNWSSHIGEDGETYCRLVGREHPHHGIVGVRHIEVRVDSIDHVRDVASLPYRPY
jgi:hypothetical protein